MPDLHLYHYSQSEFARDGVHWFHSINPRLLVTVDILRHQWSQYRGQSTPIRISQHPKAIGRRDGLDERSDHNVDYWDEVNGLDLQPDRLVTQADAEKFRDLATELMAGSIGLYPDWGPTPGFHIGFRARSTPGHPALWGAVRRVVKGKSVQVAVAYDVALAKMPAIGG